jgi:D-alanyl-lipoteichoic acid acyltransferase DltB (MBOAT superfamily)
LGGNIVFYTWSGWQPMLIVGLSGFIVYAMAIKIGNVYNDYELEKDALTPKEQVALFSRYKKRAKKYLVFSMGFILAIWIFVKLGKLVGFETVRTYGEVFNGAGIIVPLGISYYTLSTMGYLLDVYWRKTVATHDFLEFFSVMTYFPHIVQGPISKYSDLIEKFKRIPQFDYERVCLGFQLMFWGYIKKMVIADRISLYTQGGVFSNPQNFAGIEIIIAVMLCVVQLYADFSGCMDIVRGASQIMGIELAENFRQPFLAKNATEFWNRWHMTLSAWTKEYIYLPIAMNPRFLKFTKKIKKDGKPWVSSFVKGIVPLLSVWLFTGLWHGTGIDYIVWGLYWCVIMTLSKETEFIWNKVCAILTIDRERRYYKLFQCVRTYILFGIGRMFTITGSLQGCLLLWQQMFAEHKLWVLFDGTFYKYGLDQKDCIVVIIGIIMMLLVDILHEKGKALRKTIAVQPLPIRWVCYYGMIFAIIIWGIYGAGYDASSFVYGAF